MNESLNDLVSEVSTNFKRGTAEMLLLSLLTQRDWYAYELSGELKRLSRNLFDIQGPSLYTILYRMQSRGFVSTWTEPHGKRSRIYYHLLPGGREYLKLITKEYLAISNGIKEILSTTNLDTNDIHS